MQLLQILGNNQLNESLWGDEAFSALAIQQSVGEMMGVVMRDTAPPLFYLVGWLWGRLVGFSEIGLRSLSLLLMVGAGAFVALIVNKIQKDRSRAILTGLLAVLSPFLTPFAFEWRMYALLVFTIMGAIYFFVARKWWGYVLFSIAALYTHHFALFTVVGQLVWFLITEFKWKTPKTGIKQLWPWGIMGLAYLPWLYPMYLQTVRVKGAGFWLTAPTSGEVVNLGWRFITGGVPKLWQRKVGVIVGLLLITKQWGKVAKQFGELLTVVLAPFGLAILVSYAVTPIFYDRYLLSVVMGLALMIGMGTRRWMLPILATLVVLYGYFSYYQFVHPTKRPFRDLMAYVKQESKEGDKLINYNGKAHHLWESKYYGMVAPIYVPGDPLPLYVGTAQMKPGDTIRQLPQVSGRLGVIASEPIEKIIIPDYTLVANKQFDGLGFSWWERRKDQ